MTSEDRDQPEMWEAFRGQPNTDKLFRQKADVVSRLIEMALDTGLFVAEELKKTTSTINTTDSATAVMAETAGVLLHVADRIALSTLPARERDVFIDSLEQAVGEKLQVHGYSCDAFTKLLPPRYAEYAHYQDLTLDIDHPKRAVFWEFTKKIAFEMGVGKSGVFNVMVSNLLVKQLHRWNLTGLLKG